MNIKARPWFGPARKLQKRGPNCTGLVVDSEGVTLGPDFPLVSKTDSGYRATSSSEVALLLEWVFEGRGNAQALSGHLTGIAKALEAGEVVKANLLGLSFPIRSLTSHQLDRLRHLVMLYKGFNPDEPRIPAGDEGGGEWTTGEGSDAEQLARADEVFVAADPAPPTPPATRAQKRFFVETHLSDASKAANEIRVPPEFILGLTAKESGWGLGRFVYDKNTGVWGYNYLSLRGPAPYEIGHQLSHPPKGIEQAKLATFSSYEDCLRSFIAKYRAKMPPKDIENGITDPTEFAYKIQKYLRMGAGDDNYVDGVTDAIDTVVSRLF